MPVLKLDYCELTFFLWEYRRVKTIEKIIEKTELRLDSYATLVLVEDLPKNYYLPPFPLTGKTVLDIGACCGETAWYFLKHGAKKVVCIECDPARIKLIEENRKNLNLNIDIVPGMFKPEHLLIPHDFIKCDIEGYEMELLPYAKTLKPSVVEVHTGWIKDQFEKNGFHSIANLDCDDTANVSICLMANY
jgi:predicted rRNA methylase YqxC with S4 and FtsJ domains